MEERDRSEELDDETEELEERGETSQRELKEHGDKLAEDIEETRRDWERKQDDSSVPGAVPDPDEE